MVSIKGRYTSDKLVKRKKRILIWRISLVSIFLIAILGGLSFWSKHPSMKIVNIEVEGLTYMKSDSIKVAVEEELQGNYLFLFSKFNSLIYPRSFIKNRLIEEYGFIESVNLDFVNLKTIRVKIKEFEPNAKWCRKLESGTDECFLINEYGYIFTKEPLINNDQFVEFRGGIDGEPLKKIYVSTEVYTELNDLVKLLRRLDINIKEVRTENGQDFDVITDSNVKIIVDVRDDMDLVFENLETVIEKDAINKAQFGNLEYIDLRFGNRVFYKLK